MTVLERIEYLEQEAAALGLQWETKDQIMAQIRSECLEIEAHLKSPEGREALQDEIGDLLHAAFSLCVFCNFRCACKSSLIVISPIHDIKYKTHPVLIHHQIMPSNRIIITGFH